MSFENLTSQVENEEQKSQGFPQKLIDLLLTFGDDGGRDQLIELKAKVFSYISTDIKEKHKELLQEIQSKQQVNNDTLIVLKFQVQTGRQRQSFEFIEKGLDQDENNQNTSAMQKLFHRPKTTGRIQLKQGKGFIYVIYRFYQEKIQSHLSDVIKFVEAKIDFNIQLEAKIKGTTQQSKRSFVAVKPDYFQLKLQSEKLTLKDFLNFLEQGGEINQANQSSQWYQVVKNLQIATFDLKFNSIRQIMKYYNRILYEDDQQADKQKQDFREFPLLNKGIFKNFASLNFVLANKLAVQVEAKYKSQQVMLRLFARFFFMYENF